MNYGKIVNGELERFIVPVFGYVFNNAVYFSPTEEQIISFGFKPVEYSQPENIKWYNPVSKWEELSDKIVQEWEYVKQPEPDWNDMIAAYIAEKYTIAAELALLSRGKDTPAWQEKEDWVVACKNKVNAEKQEYDGLPEIYEEM